MAHAKPLYAVLYFSRGNSCLQAVKADNDTEAKHKFLKKFTKISEDLIFDVDLIEPDHKHYNRFKNSAI